MVKMETHSADILVIGGGAAGCRAAIEAASKGFKVILVDKTIFGHGGASGMHPAWDLAAGQPFAKDDSPELHFKDTLIAGGYINNQKLIKALTSEVGLRTLDLERYGNILARDEEGYVLCSRGSGHSASRYVTPALLFTLKQEIRKLNVEIVEETMITKIITSENTAVGAIGLDIVNGEPVLFSAKATILATGGGGQLYGWSTVAARTTNPVSNCGGGYSLAYEAGAELVDMEFIQFLLGLLYPSQLLGTIATVADHREYLLNGEKEQFAADVPLEKWDRARAIKEIIDIVAKGRGSPHGGVWLDTPRAFKDWKAEGYVWHFLRMQVTQDTLTPFDHDITKEMLEIYPTVHHFMGGVVIDEECETTVPGLYACGEVAGGVHGANRLGSNAYPSTQVFGRRAGKYAAMRAEKMDAIPEMNSEQVEQEKERIKSILQKEGEFTSFKIRHELQSLVWKKLGPLRSQTDIEQTIQEIKKLKEKALPKIYVSSKSKVYNREWVEALEIYQLIQVAEMIARSSLLRKESRKAYQRIDYPERDDESGLVNNYVRMEDREMFVISRPIITTSISAEQIRRGEI
jgi:fumarate reductase (CoM/CoB) subunit A